MPPTLVIRELDEVEFQGTLESCGDCDPKGLVLDGVVIGFVLEYMVPGGLDKLREFGIEVQD